jgi:hypothetical protein
MLYMLDLEVFLLLPTVFIYLLTFGAYFYVASVNGVTVHYMCLRFINYLRFSWRISCKYNKYCKGDF